MKLSYTALFLGTILHASIILSQTTPLFNSNPSAAPVILLDFDGHIINGTSWNSNGPIACGGSGLNDLQVTEIFNRVAEDFRPFELNVTTDPQKYEEAPADKRMRVIVTVSSAWYGNAGGVAFVNSFTWGDDTPCFVFSALLYYNIKYIAEACSHEAGHTLGLYHQAVYDSNCTKTSEYNTGMGTGEISWAPIMGIGYSRNLTTWNRGPGSLSCTNLQDDLSVITRSSNGITYRNDDHAGQFDSATSVVFTGNQFAINGIIERNTDKDFFKFVVPANGPFRITVSPFNVGLDNTGSNLDLQISLYDSAQRLLGSYDSPTLLESTLDTLLSHGQYYFVTEGKGNQFAPAYTSLGSYSVHATLAAVVLPLRKLELRGRINQSQCLFNWVIDADEAIEQQTLESSTDGRTYNSIAAMISTTRSFTYLPPADNVMYYRLKVLFHNGIEKYSNIIMLKQDKDSYPVLQHNPVSGDHALLLSPGNFNYSLADMQGRSLGKGKLIEGINHIIVKGWPNGIYIIYYFNDERRGVIKMIKR